MSEIDRIKKKEMLGNVLGSILILTGFVLLLTALFMISRLVGLAGIGVFLIWYGYTLQKEFKKSTMKMRNNLSHPFEKEKLN